MDNKFVLEGVPLSTLRDWLNENKMKTPVSTEGSGVAKEFTIHDVKAYCNRGRLPKYLGGNKIEKVISKKDPRIKTYNLLKENGEK